MRFLIWQLAQALCGVVPAGLRQSGRRRARPQRCGASWRRPWCARRSPARTPGTALSVGRGGLDSWLRRMGLAEVVWPMCPSFLVYSHRT